MVARAVKAAAMACGVLLLPQAGLAETITFKAELSGANESPPNDSGAGGAADATFDTESRMLTWTVEYDGLTGPAIGAHIHGPADSGGNAGIVIPFETTESPIEGSAEIPAEMVDALQSGQLYVNVHTEAHPGGEIRGQLMK